MDTESPQQNQFPSTVVPEGNGNNRDTTSSVLQNVYTTFLAKNLKKIIIVLGGLFFIFLTFTLGFLMRGQVDSKKNPNNVVIVTPEPSEQPLQSPTPEKGSNNEIRLLPNKKYYEDTLLVVTKDKPTITLNAFIARAEQESGYIQLTKINYFDGANWIRKQVTHETFTQKVEENTLIKKWYPAVNAINTFGDRSFIDIAVDDTDLQLKSRSLQSEISTRSIPEYSKFLYHGEGIITINGERHDAYYALTRAYSYNADDIVYQYKLRSLETYLLTFWDANGTFYHIDTSSVDHATPVYDNYQLGIRDNAGTVLKTNQVIINPNALKPLSEYSISLGAPVRNSVTMSVVNAYTAGKKSPVWLSGNLEGVIHQDNGSDITGIVGFMEYFHL